MTTKKTQHLGLGTAALGRPQYINIRQEDPEALSLEAFREKSREVLDIAYRRGIRYFDTAPNYGLAEQLLIDWLADKEDGSIEVATKWGYTYVANFDPDAIRHEVKEHSLAKLNEQWAQSRHLRPFLSTYQIHSATFDTGILENEAVLERLAELSAEHDLIIGLTSTGADQVEVLRKALAVEIQGVALFDAFQVTYNILDQSLKEVAGEMAARHKRIIVKEALANGRLFPNEDYPHYAALYRLLEELSEKYQVGIDAIALRFCVDSLHPYKVLSGAAEETHLTENLKAAQFILSEEDLAKLQSLEVSPSFYWKERKRLGWN